jgi:hypothetical protein
VSQSIKSDKISKSTIARIAGNLLSGFAFDEYSSDDEIRLIREAVAIARGIAAEVERTKAEGRS